MKKTVQVPVEKITADLRNGVPDAELMKECGITGSGLKSVFDKLLKAACSGSRHIEVEVKE